MDKQAYIDAMVQLIADSSNNTDPTKHAEYILATATAQATALESLILSAIAPTETVSSGQALPYAVVCVSPKNDGHIAVSSLGNPGEALTSNGPQQLPTFQSVGSSIVVISGGDYRYQRESITAGDNAITFTSALSGTVLVVKLSCKDADGAEVECTISAETTTGFSVNCPVNATLTYFAGTAI